MKRTLLTIALLLAVASGLYAQQPAKPAETRTASLPPAIATELSNAMRQEEEAKQAYLAASTRTALVLYKALAEVGIKPSECAADKNPFACVKLDPATGVLSFQKPKTEAAQTTPPKN